MRLPPVPGPGGEPTTYVYPVLSRRLGGVAVEVDLCPERTCNWRCVYCDVDGLQQGNTPDADLDRLGAELAHVLEAVGEPEWLTAHAPAGR